jgi:hypothetical protein
MEWVCERLSIVGGVASSFKRSKTLSGSIHRKLLGRKYIRTVLRACRTGSDKRRVGGMHGLCEK